MYKIRFKEITFISNRRRLSSDNIILFFYGLGCSADDLAFLFQKSKFKSQVLITELPGHNNIYYNNENLYAYARSIYLFLKRNSIKEITFFSHSIGGIIPIIMVKLFLKRKIFVKNFINYEGNLTRFDTETLTKKTSSYNFNEFVNEKFHKLVKSCCESKEKHLRSWSQSLKKTSPSAFYNLSNECVKYSESKELLNFFRIFFKRKVYLSGEKTQTKMSKYFFGSVRLKIKNCGHFSFFENRIEFTKIWNQLILKKI